MTEKKDNLNNLREEILTLSKLGVEDYEIEFLLRQKSRIENYSRY